MSTDSEITENAFRALVRTYGLFRNEMEGHFARHGLSGAQWGVLRTLHRSEKEGVPGLTPGELSRRMFVKAPSITGVIDRLERQGFVERLPSSRDLRSKQVTLTAEGRAFLLKVLKHHPAQMEKVLAPLSMTERRQLETLLSKIETHLGADAPTPFKIKKS